MADLSEVRYSTNYEPRFTLEALFKEFEITFENGDVDYRRDYAGNKIVRFIKRIQEFTPVRYDGSKPLTTLVYEAYGSTTAIWLVMLYNGVHPLEIIPGTTIKMPDLTSLEPFLMRERQSNNIGKTTIV